MWPVEMQSFGVEPQAHHLQCIHVSACEKGCQWLEALRLLARMQAQGLARLQLVLARTFKGQLQMTLLLLVTMQGLGIQVA